MKIVWSPRAIRHLEHLRAYVERDSKQNAALVAGRILKAVDLLQDHPQMGRPGRVLGTRELDIPDTTYIIPYRVRGDRLELIAVFHRRQKWPLKM
jgi:addiction module RelE/StbE family toxin